MGYKYEILWEREYTDGYAGCRVAVDSKDNIIVCGVDKENRGLVVKYDGNGNVLWADHSMPKVFSKRVFLPIQKLPSMNAMGAMLDVAVDSKDNVVVVGSFYGEDGKSCIGYVKKYSPDGKKIWDRVLSPFLYTQILGVYVDSDDNVLLAGYGGKLVPPSLHAFIYKLRSNGTIILRRIIRKIGYSGYMSILSNGNMVAGGFLSRKNEFYLMLTKFGKFGIKIKEMMLNKVAVPAKIIKDGNHFVAAGQIEKNNQYFHYLLKTDDSFSVLWENIGMNGSLYDVASSRFGLLATGKNGDEYYAALYSRNGEKLMDIFLGKLVSNGSDINDWLRGIAVDSEENAIASGGAPVWKVIKFRIMESEEKKEEEKEKEKMEKEKSIIMLLIEFFRKLFRR